MHDKLLAGRSKHDVQKREEQWSCHKCMIEGAMALRPRAESPRPLGTRVYAGIRTQVTFSKENVGSLNTCFARKITRSRQENPNVTKEASESKGKRLSRSKSGRRSMEENPLKTCVLFTSF